MQSVPQDLMREYVRSQKFTNIADIMSAMKAMFCDVIQEVMEVEMEDVLGQECCQHSGGEPTDAPKNYRNGYSKKIVKTQLGAVDIQSTPWSKRLV